MQLLTKRNINLINVTELNNGYQFRLQCLKTSNEISVYKEHSIYNVKINHVNMITNSIEWLQIEKLSTVKEYLKQLI